MEMCSDGNQTDLVDPSEREMFCYSLMTDKKRNLFEAKTENVRTRDRIRIVFGYCATTSCL